jgi:hypothetical protein
LRAQRGSTAAGTDEGLRARIEKLDGTRLYIPNSASVARRQRRRYSLPWPGGHNGIKQYFNDMTSSVPE